LIAYGPVEDEHAARELAAFLTVEVDPATAMSAKSPTKELLAYWRNARNGTPATVGQPDYRPEYWPPQPGHIWQDRNQDRWIGTATPHPTSYLVCLARQADDNAEEIWRLYGPMTFVQLVAPTEEECPF
jgi:hypothetical protein